MSHLRIEYPPAVSGSNNNRTQKRALCDLWLFFLRLRLLKLQDVQVKVFHFQFYRLKVLYPTQQTACSLLLAITKGWARLRKSPSPNTANSLFTRDSCGTDTGVCFAVALSLPSPLARVLPILSMVGIVASTAR